MPPLFSIPRRPVAARAAALIVLACWPAAARAETVSVAATVRYGDGTLTELPVYDDVRVTITRNGEALAVDQRLPEPARNSFFTPPRLLALDLDDDAEPEVMVDVFTAGYDCCRRTVVLHLEAGRYVPRVIDWDAGGYRLRNVTGGKSPELLTTDARVAALYRSDARGPLRILRIQAGVLTDISGRVPAQLLRDARIHARALTRARRRGDGDRRAIIAAYVIDLVRAGQGAQAARTLRAADRRGELGTSTGRFARRIDQRLVAWGYVAAPVLLPAVRALR